MPNDRTPNREYSILKYLSTEELEHLLCQDFDMSGTTEPDTDYITAIMEVIRERETMSSPNTDSIVDAAWNDFFENYQGQHITSYADALRESESSHLGQTSITQPPRRKLRFLRYVLIAAMVGVLLCGAASAFGFNVFQALADWTSETFGFVSTIERGNSDTPEDPYANYKSIVEEITSIPLVPQWAPNGTTQSGDIAVIEQSDRVKISGLYSIPTGELNLRVIVYNDIPITHTGSYQKDHGEVVACEISGITHYFMSNNDTNLATWTSNNVEILIQGNLSLEDLEKIVDSIYEEQ